MNFRIGIIGCGAMTLGAYVPALRSVPGVYTVVAVADPSEERRDLVGDGQGRVRIHAPGAVDLTVAL